MLATESLCHPASSWKTQQSSPSSWGSMEQRSSLILVFPWPAQGCDCRPRKHCTASILYKSVPTAHLWLSHPTRAGWAMVCLPHFEDLQGTKWFPEQCEPSDLDRVAPAGQWQSQGCRCPAAGQVGWAVGLSCGLVLLTWVAVDGCVPYLLPVSAGYIAGLAVHHAAFPCRMKAEVKHS